MSNVLTVTLRNSFGEMQTPVAFTPTAVIIELPGGAQLRITEQENKLRVQNPDGEQLVVMPVVANVVEISTL